MKVALVNPHWHFEGSIYFGCQHEHLPLELGYADALLRASGHDVLLLDGALCGLDQKGLADAVNRFQPDLTVVTTAPTYLFWRCTQPELTVPFELLNLLDPHGLRVAVGPHSSVTPGATLRKLPVDAVIRGECEEAILEIAAAGSFAGVKGCAWLQDDELICQGAPRAARFVDLPSLHWPQSWIARHHHHHHRFGVEVAGFGAEVEASRGCPYHCSFCAKMDYRDAYRRRRLDLLLGEIDGLIAQGVGYLYFVDEIFLPQRELLETLCDRPVKFGVQTRIDLWKPEMLQLLGAAGCVSIEAGVESLTVDGRAALQKKCRMETSELADRLILARRYVPFVQANLIKMEKDEADLVASWRAQLGAHDVWANDPVPLYPYPSSPSYHALFGAPDDQAWERAHDHYLAQFDRLSDLQSAQPLSLPELERDCHGQARCACASC